MFVLLVPTMALGVVSVPEQIVIGKDSQQTIALPGTRRVAVGNSKILRVKAVSPDKVLLTGVSLGKTSITFWNLNGQEGIISVSVVPAASLESSKNNPRGQVAHISLQFLELNETVGRSSGFQWPDTLTFSGEGSVQSFSTGINYSITLSTAQGFLNFLVRSGWAKLVASPELYVRLGEQAVFHSGGEIPITTTTDSYIRFQRRVEWKKYGLTAKVKPDSSDLIHFQSDIQLEITELDHSYQVENIPALTARNFLTKMDSLDGETVILSGLTRQSSQREEKGIPWLSRLPILGDLLFSQTSSGRKETELLMAVTVGLTTRARESDRLESVHKKFERRHD
ncbi:hypothetical protein EBR78_02545 [bacterium]|nr:hypothetical protein [bacterium]